MELSETNIFKLRNISHHIDQIKVSSNRELSSLKGGLLEITLTVPLRSSIKFPQFLMLCVKVSKLSEHAIIPTRGSVLAAG